MNLNSHGHDPREERATAKEIREALAQGLECHLQRGGRSERINNARTKNGALQVKLLIGRGQWTSPPDGCSVRIATGTAGEWSIPL